MPRSNVVALVLILALITFDTASANTAGKAVAAFARDVLKDVAKSIISDILKDAIKASAASSPSPQSSSSLPLPVVAATTQDAQRTLNILRELTDTNIPLAERIGLYAARVDYFGAGVVDRDFIKKDRVYFESRWPSRRYSIAKVNQIAIAPDGTYVVARYTVEYHVTRPGDSRSGKSDVAVVIGSFNSQPRVHSIKEWVYPKS